MSTSAHDTDSQSARPHTAIESDERIFAEFPHKWKAPDSPIVRCIFTMCCCIFTGHSNLEWLHNTLKKENTWETLHSQYLQQIQYISTVQGLVLTTAAVFITTTPPLLQDVDYISYASYACLAESLVFSLFGLLFQLKVYTSEIIFQPHSTAKAIIRTRWRIFGHILSLAVPIIIFVISVTLLLMAVVLTGFTSRSETVKIYLSITFGFLGLCLLVSSLGSPLGYFLSDKLFGITSNEGSKTTKELQA
ncbi:hypothetical protein BDR04DRAFT_1109520 [Suillus decipiens]|nr:hypothetical protein BDR04DRAFT_1109520 [Suillus decipiens]